MKADIELVKAGYANLSWLEREEVKKFIIDIDSRNFDEDRALREELNANNKFMMGPRGTDIEACTCCKRPF